VRTLEQVQADLRSWHGSPRQLFESVCRDPYHPLDLRLHAAATLLRFEPPDTVNTSDKLVERLTSMTSAERLEHAAQLLAQWRTLVPEPPIIDATPVPAQIEARPEPAWATMQAEIDRLRQQIAELQAERQNAVRERT
jgi:hypothetical protein